MAKVIELKNVADEAYRASEGFRHHPVSKELAALLESRQASRVEILSTDKMYQVLCKYIGDNSTYVQSWRVRFKKSDNKINFHLTEDEERSKMRDGVVKMDLGLGIHELKWKGESIKAVHQVIGDPVGLYGKVDIMTTLIIVIEKPNKKALLKEFLLDAWDWAHKIKTDQYKVFGWKANYEYWNELTTKRCRPMDSIILPENVKELVVKDLTDFCSRRTARWYIDNGVPYKRSLLFYGPPGTGKSSLITGLAGLLQRSVCFLQPAHPQITDDNLQTAIQKAPARSIIVLEDVDSLFDNKRKKEESMSPLTFSGLLNALDGVCNPEGHIFILTTNHIERLDPALIRAGRVDVKIQFPAATARQAELLFLHFYPGESELAKEFAGILYERFPSKCQKVEELQASTSDVEGWNDSHRLSVSMAALGQLFVAGRHSPASHVIHLAKNDFSPEIQEAEESDKCTPKPLAEAEEEKSSTPAGSSDAA